MWFLYMIENPKTISSGFPSLPRMTPEGIPPCIPNPNGFKSCHQKSGPPGLQVPRQQFLLGHTEAILPDATGNQLHDPEMHVVLFLAGPKNPLLKVSPGEFTW